MPTWFGSWVGFYLLYLSWRSWGGGKTGSAPAGARCQRCLFPLLSGWLLPRHALRSSAVSVTALLWSSRRSALYVVVGQHLIAGVSAFLAGEAAPREMKAAEDSLR